MQFQRCSAAGLSRIKLAIELLRRVSLEEFRWFKYVVTRLYGRSASCGCSERTIACTYIDWDGRIAVGFHRDPGQMEVPEIAESLRHEARHWRYGPQLGTVELVPHTCTDPGCLLPWQRAIDPIYRADERFRRLFHSKWMSQGEDIFRTILPDQYHQAVLQERLQARIRAIQAARREAAARQRAWEHFGFQSSY